MLRRWSTRLLAGVSLALGAGVVSGAQAAEQLTVKLGPIKQSVAIADLEHYASTGEIQRSLRVYSLFLNDTIRTALNSSIPLEPKVGDKLVADLLNSVAGERLLQAMQTMVPNSSPEELHKALTRAATRSEGLSLLGVMREFPAQQITVDVASAIRVASQMNLPYWQSQSLSSILDRELTVQKTEPIKSPLDPTKHGPQWVRHQTLVFRDRDRRRTIPVDLYWARRTQGPLIVISHGFGADRRFLGYLAQHLASYGFTVAALEHPGSNVAWLTSLTSGRLLNNKMIDILPATEFIDRPADVSFLLSELERLNRNSTFLRGKLNTNEVTVIGHSLGGYTALALAGAELKLHDLQEFCSQPDHIGLSVADWLQCTAADLPKSLPNMRDRRVVQVIALNPVIGRLFDEASLAKIRTPTVVLSATNDAIMPAVSQQLLPFTYLQGDNKLLLTAIGATHLSVGDPDNLNQALTQSLFVKELQGAQTESLRTLLQGVTLSFVKQLTPDAKRYQPFLTPAYVQSFSTVDLKLRLSANLSEKLSSWLSNAALPLEQMTSPSPLETQRKVSVIRATSAGLTFLLVGLPLVMFILPGHLPLFANRLLRLGDREFKRKSK